MPNSPPEKPVYRFAPSPNGFLHLGHALSAFLNHDMAKASGGRFLLRIEDIDLTRCTAEFEEMIYRDLTWLGLDWEMPVRRQSEHFDAYRDALDRLRSMGLVYPTFLTRGEVKAHVTAYETNGKNWPRDPDGSPLYPDDDRLRNEAERAHLIAKGIKHAWRMDVMKAMALVGKQLSWQETGTGHPETIDALQGITHVVRGEDLYTATAIHRLLQELLGLPEPVYHHHQLIVGSDGRKLSKSEGSTGIAALRDEGLLPGDIRRIVGL